MKRSSWIKPWGLAVSLSLPAAGVCAQADLSDDSTNPTVITLTDGLTAFENTVVNSGTGLPNADIDFFTIVVPTGLQIDRISLTRYEPDGAFSFFGFEEGPTVSADPSGSMQDQTTFSENALGFALVGANQLNNDLRRALADGEVNTGALLAGNRRFDPTVALPAGTYAFVFQDTGALEITYELSFEASVIPEPNSLALLGLLGMASLYRGRGRRLGC